MQCGQSCEWNTAKQRWRNLQSRLYMSSTARYSRRLADYSAVKDMLTVEVVGKDQNAEMLQSVPYQEMEDLAAVYRIDLGETENGNATVLITNEMLKNYGLTTDQPVTFSSPLYVATTDRDTFGEGVLDVPSLKMPLRKWTGIFMFCPCLCMKFCFFLIVLRLSISF